MKKIVSILLSISLIFIFTMQAVADEPNEISVLVDGEKITFDVPPQIINGRTMVPIRAIFEAMGAIVTWDGNTKTVTAQRGNNIVKMSLGSCNVDVNGAVTQMDISPALIDDRTLAPARYVAESFGYTVQWNGETRNVNITSPETELLTVHYIDVGQADAILIEADDKTMLIDGGNVEDSDLIYSYLKKENIDYIDYVLATHIHEDHVGGLSGALSKAKVGKIFANASDTDAEFYQNFLTKAVEQGLTISSPTETQKFKLGSATVELFIPTDYKTADTNNTSILVKITFGSMSFLFTGDAEMSAEKNFVEQGINLKSTVLKAGHHGADTSSSYQFLKEVMPEYVVISVGADNSYGHPDENALSRFKDVGAKVLRTDMQGDIVIESDGTSITVKTEKSTNTQTNPTEKEKQEMLSDKDDFQYIGNKNSKKFHLTNCTSLPEENNRLYFHTRDEAISSGYIGCKKCNP